MINEHEDLLILYTNTLISILIHSWTVGIPVSSLNFKLKSCTLLSSLLKVKFWGILFSGEFCSDIESISTILSAA